MIFMKKLTTPVSNDTQQVDAVQLWEVRWSSAHFIFGEMRHSDERPEIEVFTSESLAIEFKKSLENALSLLRYTGKGTAISMAKSAAK